MCYLIIHESHRGRSFKISNIKIIWTIEEELEIVRLYLEEKWSCFDIAMSLGVSAPTINKVIKSYGVIRDVGKGHIVYSQDNDFFKKIDTEEKAYWLGFIYADGSIVENKRTTIGLNILDEGHLKKFLKSIKSNRSIKYVNKITDKKTYHTCYVNISSNDFTKNLVLCGCPQNKTDKLVFPNEDILPKNLTSHFIRGYMDGDGSVHINKTNKNTGHKYFRLSFTGNYQMLNSIKSILTEKDIKIENRKTYCSLQFNGNIQVLRMLNYIYKDATIYLDRKYEKYMELKKQHI